MKAIKILVIIFISLVVGAILVSYFIWLSYPKTKLNIYVLDKTVKDFSYNEHRSLFWVLNNARVVNSEGGSYSVSDDYYGFFPKKPLSESQYELRRISLEQVDSISNVYDALYYVDTYGVYYNEWFRGFKRGSDNSVIEGGLNYNDFLLLKAMKEKHKLIIAEASTVSAPTAELIRFKIEELFGIQTTGWEGKYFETLDTTEGDDYLIELANRYKSLNEGKWPYKNAGIVFKNSDKVIVLENGTHLNAEDISIVAKSGSKLNIPASIAYTNWFEVVTTADSNEVAATYQLNVNELGESLLKENNLSTNFPAIVYSNGGNSNMYYFAGDFSENTVTSFYSKLANSRQILMKVNKSKGKQFFYNFYFPLLESIFKSNSVK